MKVNRVERIRLRSGHSIGCWCHAAKNLYNAANYQIRQRFFSERYWIRYNKLDKLVRELYPSDYRSLPAASSQWVLKILDRNWKSFFRAIKERKAHSDKFLGRPKLPGYLPKNGESILVFTNKQCKIKNEMLRFPERIDLKVKTRLPDRTNLREVRIVPKGGGYFIEIVYRKDVPDISDTEPQRIGSIDLGLSNLVTLVDNIGSKPIIIKGGVVKSVNHYFNRRLAELRSIYDRQGIKKGKKSRKLFDKRNAKIDHHFHEISRIIIDLCKKRNLDTLVIGYNEGWKQNINLGRRTNQNFVQVPFLRFLNQLKYKGEDIGIRVINNDEAHTSKCSFLDGEAIGHHEQYVGRRVKRGLFRSANGTIINADVNGAYNILKKAVPNAFADGIQGVGLHPERSCRKNRPMRSFEVIQQQCCGVA